MSTSKQSVVNNYFPTTPTTEKSRTFKTFKIFNCNNGNLIEGNKFDIGQNFQLVTLMESDMYHLNEKCLGIQQKSHKLIPMRTNSDSVILHQNKFLLYRPRVPKDIPEDDTEQLTLYWKEYDQYQEQELYGVVMLTENSV